MGEAGIGRDDAPVERQRMSLQCAAAEAENEITHRAIVERRVLQPRGLLREENLEDFASARALRAMLENERAHFFQSRLLLAQLFPRIAGKARVERAQSRRHCRPIGEAGARRRAGEGERIADALEGLRLIAEPIEIDVRRAGGAAQQRANGRGVETRIRGEEAEIEIALLAAEKLRDPQRPEPRHAEPEQSERARARGMAGDDDHRLEAPGAAECLEPIAREAERLIGARRSIGEQSLPIVAGLLESGEDIERDFVDRRFEPRKLHDVFCSEIFCSCVNHIAAALLMFALLRDTSKERSTRPRDGGVRKAMAREARL